MDLLINELKSAQQVLLTAAGVIIVFVEIIVGNMALIYFEEDETKKCITASSIFLTVWVLTILVAILWKI